MKSAALELGTHKITVNAVESGLIDTAMTRNNKRWSEAVGETVAVFLASDAAEMVTGVCYDVNGGNLLHDLG